MDSPSPPGALSDFQQALLALREDPQIGQLALRWAGDLDLAEDDLQTAYCKVFSVRTPERIVNRRAYFLRVLKNEAIKRYAPRQDTPLENPDIALAPVRSVEEKVCSSLRDQTWLNRLADQRGRLLAAIPARSRDPVRYKALIYNTAGQVLRDGINGEPIEADTNNALRAAYAEFFAEPGVSADLLHQRFRRARLDARALLKAIVDRNELT